jgi:tRNA(Arg) A34 adenosine deaminase TadA
VAAGDQPYGAVVVRRGRIVGLGPSRIVTNADPTAHAELEAIRDAVARLPRGDLAGCVLYATSQPCAMCETAASFAGVSRMVVGSVLANAGRPRYGGR